MDVEQEQVLNSEIKRLKVEKAEQEVMDGHLGQYEKLQHWRLTFDAERIGLDLQVLKSRVKDDETVDRIRQSVVLKERQQKLTEGTLATLLEAMDADYGRQESRLYGIIAFKNDLALTEWRDFCKLEAVVKDPYPTQLRFFDMLQWKENYRLQPWRAM